MGKKQHQKDKLYLTTKEWRDLYGGHKHKIAANSAASSTYVRLPFCCCSITFQPFENPVCSPDGAVYEKANILEFLGKYGRHPITGDKLAVADLVDLHFHRDANGLYSCPITCNVFNEHSHIVAIRSSGNVYSWDAVEELNLKCKNYTDVLNGMPFKGKADIINIQDPVNVERFDISKFYHVRYSMKTSHDDPSDPGYCLNNLNSEAMSVLKKIKSEPKQFDPAVSKAIASPRTESKDTGGPNSIQACHISTGALAASFTSTAMSRVTVVTPKTKSVNSLVWARLRAKHCKGYVSLVTNMGCLNLELFASNAPKTVHNFLLLCRRGYYDNCMFFRSIRHFIVQTGDKSNTGTGGESAWPDEPFFNDEISESKEMKHDKRGVLSMANSGPNTNGSQFFITYRPCNHLNGKHTVFGRLVGGFDTLAKIESIEVDDKDRPKVDVTILRVGIFDDPALLIEDAIAKEIEQEENERKGHKPPPCVPSGKRVATCERANSGVAKYLSGINECSKDSAGVFCEYAQKKKLRLEAIGRRRDMGDLSGW